jgi:hypothetical protein
VGVIETIAGRLGDEADASASVRRNKRRALLGGAIDVGGDELAVPVQLLRRVGLIVDIDGDLLAFFKASRGPGNWPLYVVVEMMRFGPSSTGLTAMVRV